MNYETFLSFHHEPCLSKSKITFVMQFCSNSRDFSHFLRNRRNYKYKLTNSQPLTKRLTDKFNLNKNTLLN